MAAAARQLCVDSEGHCSSAQLRYEDVRTVHFSLPDQVLVGITLDVGELSRME
jgi:hypothetical protein